MRLSTSSSTQRMLLGRGMGTNIDGRDGEDRGCAVLHVCFPLPKSGHTFPAVTYNTFLSPDILVVRFSSIGDILLTTPLLRAIRNKWPGARVTMLTKRQYVPLVSDNPNVTEVFGITPQDTVRSVPALIKRVRYSHLLDLQGGTRTWPLRLLVRGPWSGFSHRRVARELLIRFKHNNYHEHVPVPERYFEAAADLGVEPDGGPPEFFLNPFAEENAAALAHPGRDRHQARAGGDLAGAAHATKRWPVEHWIKLAARSSTPAPTSSPWAAPRTRRWAPRSRRAAGPTWRAPPAS